MGRDVVFISYSHADRPWVDRLLVLLAPLVRNRRMELWADPYIPVGGDWRRELDGAIDRAGSAVLLVSADFLASRFIVEEELPALAARGVRLAPVLVRDCLWEYEPLLERVQWAHDPGREGPLESGGDRDARLVRICRRLIEIVGVEGPAGLDDAGRRVVTAGGGAAVLAAPARPGALDGVPPLPPGYVERDDLDFVRAALVEAGTGAVGVTGNAAALGLHGQGGIGKSVLAAAVARDDRVRACFPDGVFWVTVGERADLVGVQVDLLRRLGRSGVAARSASDGLRLLREALADRRTLLVVDDVWSDADAAAFRAAGPQGRILYTSRDARVLAGVDARTRQVEVLPEAAARQLLARISGAAAGPLPPAAARVLAATGRVPLALALVAAAVRGGMSWARLAAELDRGSGTFLDHPYANTFKAMQVATAALPARLREAYVSLAVYPPDTAVPVAAVERFWAHQRGLPADAVLADLTALAEAELLRLIDGRVTFHDLQHDYLILQADDLTVLHRDLLAAYRGLLPDDGRDGWWRLPGDEPYIWDHLVHHLRMAGDRAGLRATVTDVAFLCCRIARHGAHAAEADLDLAAEAIADDPEIDHLRRWLTRHAHLFTSVDGVGDVAAAMLCWLDPADPAPKEARLRPLLPARHLRLRWGLEPLPQASLRTLTGHAGDVEAVAFRSDGSLVSAGADGVLRCWDPETGRQLAELSGGPGGVRAVAFSPDGRLLASAGNDRKVRLWDVETGRESAVLAGHSGIVRAVAFSPDGRLLVSAGDDGKPRLWEVGTGREPAVLTGHSETVRAVAFSPDSRSVASAGDDRTVRLWEVATGRESAALLGHTDRVTAVAFSPDGELIATSSYDTTVVLWEAATGQRRAELTGHLGWVHAVAFAPDGRLLVSAGSDETVRWWDPDAGEQRARLSGHGGAVWAVAVSPDGRLVASASVDGTVRLWDSATHQHGADLDGRSRWVTTVAFSPDGRSIASAGSDSVVRLWAVGTGRRQIECQGHSSWVNAVAYSQDGRRVASVGYDRMVRSWDVATGRQLAELEFSPSDWATSVAFRGDGLLAAGGSDRMVRVWAAGADRQPSVLSGHTDWVRAVAFSPDVRWLASAGDDASVRLWDVAAGRQHEELAGHLDAVRAVAFSPDARCLASGSADGTVRLWDPADGRPQAVLAGHPGQVNAVAFSPDGTLLISVDDAGSLSLWEVARQELIHRLPLGRPLVSVGWAGSLIGVASQTVVMLEIVAAPDPGRSF